MNENDNNVLDIEEYKYYTDFQEASEILKSWYKQKPTKDMRRLFNAFTDISVYVTQMQQRQRVYDEQLSKFRSAKLRAVERARRAEEKLNKIENA
tara:strand:+ start:591 stop:875 length:285 start_codon:yes stop_codon:yes gene_type:complete